MTLTEGGGVGSNPGGSYVFINNRMCHPKSLNEFEKMKVLVPFSYRK